MVKKKFDKSAIKIILNQLVTMLFAVVILLLANAIPILINDFGPKLPQLDINQAGNLTYLVERDNARESLDRIGDIYMIFTILAIIIIAIVIMFFVNRK